MSIHRRAEAPGYRRPVRLTCPFPDCDGLLDTGSLAVGHYPNHAYVVCPGCEFTGDVFEASGGAISLVLKREISTAALPHRRPVAFARR